MYKNIYIYIYVYDGPDIVARCELSCILIIPIFFFFFGKEDLEFFLILMVLGIKKLCDIT